MRYHDFSLAKKKKKQCSKTRVVWWVLTTVRYNKKIFGRFGVANESGLGATNHIKNRLGFDSWRVEICRCWTTIALLNHFLLSKYVYVDSLISARERSCSDRFYAAVDTQRRCYANTSFFILLLIYIRIYSYSRDRKIVLKLFDTVMNSK